MTSMWHWNMCQFVDTHIERALVRLCFLDLQFSLNSFFHLPFASPSEAELPKPENCIDPNALDFCLYMLTLLKCGGT